MEVVCWATIFFRRSLMLEVAWKVSLGGEVRRGGGQLGTTWGPWEQQARPVTRCQQQGGDLGQVVAILSGLLMRLSLLYRDGVCEVGSSVYKFQIEFLFGNCTFSWPICVRMLGAEKSQANLAFCVQPRLRYVLPGVTDDWQSCHIIAFVDDGVKHTHTNYKGRICI